MQLSWVEKIQEREFLFTLATAIVAIAKVAGYAPSVDGTVAVLGFVVAAIAYTVHRTVVKSESIKFASAENVEMIRKHVSGVLVSEPTEKSH